MKLELRQRLLASTLLIGAAAFSTPALAQSDEANSQEETADVGDPAARLCADNPNAPECADEGQAIVVTGSRIASPTLTSASPLQVVDAQDIDEAGVVNVQEVLLENPAFGTPGISRTNSNFSTSSAGVAIVDLRNLGSNRTLVLVNGRRFVAGVPGSSAVDLNAIPTQFIERIDILTGGASSIYGSDAVAGVVNIIYKDDFEGIELSGQLGVSQRGDDVRKQANVILGTNFADGRGNVTVYLGYSDEGAVFSRNRSRSNIDQTTCLSVAVANGGCNSQFDRTFEAYRPFLSGFSPAGTIFYGNASTTFDISGRPIPVNTNGLVHVNDGVPATVRPCTTADPCRPNLDIATGFNRSAFRTIAIPTERYLMALRGNYEITDDIGFFVEGTFAKTSTTTEIEPFALASLNINPVTGQIPIEFDTVDAAGATVRVRNPLVPEFVFNGATDTDGDGLRDVYFIRRLSDFGNRGATADRTTFRFLAGLEGTVFGDWRWDAFYSYGETTESQVSGGQVNVQNFLNALTVGPDVADVDADGNTTEPICLSAIARAQGCVPADVYNGAGRISPAAVAYIQAPGLLNTKTSQKLAGANLSGTLFDLWGAGETGLAVGVEYRKEFSDAQFDPLTTAGLNGGNALPRTTGTFDVIEGYAELAVPILRDVPFFHLLEARGAVRVSDYSSVGTTYSWNYGLEWAPVPDVRFRAVKARATRAPNIGELFTPPSQTFPPGLQDPCEGVGPTGDSPNGGQGALCRAVPGIAANIAANGVFTLTQADIQGISGFNAGNPNLGEEKGDSLTLGVVVNPTSIDWLRNFAFTFDYFNIEVKDAIVFTPRQFILDQCYVEGNANFCNFIIRLVNGGGNTSAGALAFINTGPTNSGGLKTSGFDVTASYRQNLEDWGLAGRLNARLSWTHVLKGYVIPLPDSDKDQFNREIGASRNKVFGSLAYEYEDWGLTLRGTYIGPAYLNDQFTGIAPGEEDSDLFKIGSEFVADMQLRFTPGDHYEFYFGVDNLFDNEPPPILSNLPSNVTGAETDAGTYDAIGRRFYAGARLKF